MNNYFFVRLSRSRKAFNLIELVFATVIFGTLLTGFFSGLSVLNRRSNFQTKRSRVLYVLNMFNDRLGAIRYIKGGLPRDSTGNVQEDKFQELVDPMKILEENDDPALKRMLKGMEITLKDWVKLDSVDFQGDEAYELTMEVSWEGKAGDPIVFSSIIHDKAVRFKE